MLPVHSKDEEALKDNITRKRVKKDVRSGDTNIDDIQLIERIPQERKMIKVSSDSTLLTQCSTPVVQKMIKMPSDSTLLKHSNSYLPHSKKKMIKTLSDSTLPTQSGMSTPQNEIYTSTTVSQTSGMSTPQNDISIITTHSPPGNYKTCNESPRNLISEVSTISYRNINEIELPTQEIIDSSQELSVEKYNSKDMEEINVTEQEERINDADNRDDTEVRRDEHTVIRNVSNSPTISLRSSLDSSCHASPPVSVSSVKRNPIAVEVQNMVARSSSESLAYIEIDDNDEEEELDCELIREWEEYSDEEEKVTRPVTKRQRSPSEYRNENDDPLPKRTATPTPSNHSDMIPDEPIVETVIAVCRELNVQDFERNRSPTESPSLDPSERFSSESSPECVRISDVEELSVECISPVRRIEEVGEDEDVSMIFIPSSPESVIRRREKLPQITYINYASTLHDTAPSMEEEDEELDPIHYIKGRSSGYLPENYDTDGLLSQYPLFSKTRKEKLQEQISRLVIQEATPTEGKWQQELRRLIDSRYSTKYPDRNISPPSQPYEFIQKLQETPLSDLDHMQNQQGKAFFVAPPKDMYHSIIQSHRRLENSCSIRLAQHGVAREFNLVQKYGLALQRLITFDGQDKSQHKHECLVQMHHLLAQIESSYSQAGETQAIERLTRLVNYCMVKMSQEIDKSKSSSQCSESSQDSAEISNNEADGLLRYLADFDVEQYEKLQWDREENELDVQYTLRRILLNISAMIINRMRHNPVPIPQEHPDIDSFEHIEQLMYVNGLGMSEANWILQFQEAKALIDAAKFVIQPRVDFIHLFALHNEFALYVKQNDISKIHRAFHFLRDQDIEQQTKDRFGINNLITLELQHNICVMHVKMDNWQQGEGLIFYILQRIEFNCKRITVNKNNECDGMSLLPYQRLARDCYILQAHINYKQMRVYQNHYEARSVRYQMAYHNLKVAAGLEPPNLINSKHPFISYAHSFKPHHLCLRALRMILRLQHGAWNNLDDAWTFVQYIHSSIPVSIEGVRLIIDAETVEDTPWQSTINMMLWIRELIILGHKHFRELTEREDHVETEIEERNLEILREKALRLYRWGMEYTHIFLKHELDRDQSSPNTSPSSLSGIQPDTLLTGNLSNDPESVRDQFRRIYQHAKYRAFLLQYFGDIERIPTEHYQRNLENLVTDVLEIDCKTYDGEMFENSFQAMLDYKVWVLNTKIIHDVKFQRRNPHAEIPHPIYEDELRLLRTRYDLLIRRYPQFLAERSPPDRMLTNNVVASIQQHKERTSMFRRKLNFGMMLAFGSWLRNDREAAKNTYRQVVNDHLSAYEDQEDNWFKIGCKDLEEQSANLEMQLQELHEKLKLTREKKENIEKSKENEDEIARLTKDEKLCEHQLGILNKYLPDLKPKLDMVKNHQQHFEGFKRSLRIVLDQSALHFGFPGNMNAFKNLEVAQYDYVYFTHYLEQFLNMDVFLRGDQNVVQYLDSSVRPNKIPKWQDDVSFYAILHQDLKVFYERQHQREEQRQRELARPPAQVENKKEE